jgi:hypothetical protein
MQEMRCLSRRDGKGKYPTHLLFTILRSRAVELGAVQAVPQELSQAVPQELSQAVPQELLQALPQELLQSLPYRAFHRLTAEKWLPEAG